MKNTSFLTFIIFGTTIAFTLYSFIQENLIENSRNEDLESVTTINNLKNRLLLQINANNVCIESNILTCVDKSILQSLDTLKKGKIGLFISREQCVNCWQKDLEYLFSLKEKTKANNPIILADDYSVRELKILQNNYSDFSVYSINCNDNLDLLHLKKYKLPFFFKVNNNGCLTSIFFPIDNILKIVENDYFTQYPDTSSLVKEEFVTEEKLKLNIKNPIVDLGDVPFRKKREVIFKITNNETITCHINEVIPTCTCISISSFPEKIYPGETKEVIVSFISTSKGKFNRQIILKTNFSNEPYELTLIGKVL